MPSYKPSTVEAKDDKVEEDNSEIVEDDSAAFFYSGGEYRNHTTTGLGLGEDA